jgi:hypothetical protein
MSIRALPLSLAERQRLNRFDELCREVMDSLPVRADASIAEGVFLRLSFGHILCKP